MPNETVASKTLQHTEVVYKPELGFYCVSVDVVEASFAQGLEDELFKLRNQCGICVCPSDCHDEACASCIADKPNVFTERDSLRQQLAEANKQIAELKSKCEGWAN